MNGHPLSVPVHLYSILRRVAALHTPAREPHDLIDVQLPDWSFDLQIGTIAVGRLRPTIAQKV
jgi:hypothetical protein